MTRSVGIQERRGSRSAARARWKEFSTVPAATLRRPHDSGQAYFAWLEEEKKALGVVKRRDTTHGGGGGFEDNDDDSEARAAAAAGQVFSS